MGLFWFSGPTLGDVWREGLLSSVTKRPAERGRIEIAHYSYRCTGKNSKSHGFKNSSRAFPGLYDDPRST